MTYPRHLGELTIEEDAGILATLLDLASFVISDPLYVYNVYPYADSTYYLGQDANRFANVYADELTAVVVTVGTLDYADATINVGSAGTIEDDGSIAYPYLKILTKFPDIDTASAILIQAQGDSNQEAFVMLGGAGDPDEYAQIDPYIHLWVGPSADSDYYFFGGQAEFKNPLDLADYLRHRGDTDTYLYFTTDKIQFSAGAVTLLELVNTTQDVSHFNSANGDIDFQVDTILGNGSLFVEGATGRVGLNIISSLTGLLHVNQDAAAGAIPAVHLEQDDVSEEFVRFTGTAAAATLTNSLVAEADVTTATRIGFVKINIQDEGDQIADGPAFVAAYTLA